MTNWIKDKYPRAGDAEVSGIIAEVYGSWVTSKKEADPLSSYIEGRCDGALVALSQVAFYMGRLEEVKDEIDRRSDKEKDVRSIP
jgi:hypothetical protein